MFDSQELAEPAMHETRPFTGQGDDQQQLRFSEGCARAAAWPDDNLAS